MAEQLYNYTIHVTCSTSENLGLKFSSNLKCHVARNCFAFCNPLSVHPYFLMWIYDRRPIFAKSILIAFEIQFASIFR